MEFAPFGQISLSPAAGVLKHRLRRLNNSPKDTDSVFHFSFFIFTLICFRSLFSDRFLCPGFRANINDIILRIFIHKKVIGVNSRSNRDAVHNKFQFPGFNIHPMFL
jgi:hypothetical protein